MRRVLLTRLVRERKLLKSSDLSEISSSIFWPHYWLLLLLVYTPSIVLISMNKNLRPKVSVTFRLFKIRVQIACTVRHFEKNAFIPDNKNITTSSVRGLILLISPGNVIVFCRLPQQEAMEPAHLKDTRDRKKWLGCIDIIRLPT